MEIALTFYTGLAVGYALAVCARRMGERSQELDAVKPGPRTTRVTLHGIDFDEEAFYGWAERGGMY